jgi:hypothetical protein
VKPLLVSLVVAIATLSAGQTAQTFTGVVTDSECSTANHAQMRMGPTDADCVKACVSAHGASYVLYDGKDVYALTDQQAPEKFAGTKVRVVGTLDAKTKTIRVQSMSAAQ